MLSVSFIDAIVFLVTSVNRGMHYMLGDSKALADSQGVFTKRFNE
jgi:hypothetical protein